MPNTTQNKSAAIKSTEPVKALVISEHSLLTKNGSLANSLKAEGNSQKKQAKFSYENINFEISFIVNQPYAKTEVELSGIDAVYIIADNLNSFKPLYEKMQSLLLGQEGMSVYLINMDKNNKLAKEFRDYFKEKGISGSIAYSDIDSTTPFKEFLYETYCVYSKNSKFKKDHRKNNTLTEEKPETDLLNINEQEKTVDLNKSASIQIPDCPNEKPETAAAEVEEQEVQACSESNVTTILNATEAAKCQTRFFTDPEQPRAIGYSSIDGNLEVFKIMFINKNSMQTSQIIQTIAHELHDETLERSHLQTYINQGLSSFDYTVNNRNIRFELYSRSEKHVSTALAKSAFVDCKAVCILADDAITVKYWQGKLEEIKHASENKFEIYNIKAGAVTSIKDYAWAKVIENVYNRYQESNRLVAHQPMLKRY